MDSFGAEVFQGCQWISEKCRMNRELFVLHICIPREVKPQEWHYIYDTGNNDGNTFEFSDRL